MSLLNSRFKRKKWGRDPRKAYVIFCEWHSEAIYFNYLKSKSSKLIETFILQNKAYEWIPDEINAIKIMNWFNENDCFFCVIDKDEHSIEEYNNYIKGIENVSKVVFSSISFEVWVLMHFSRFDKNVYKVSEYKPLINSKENKKYFKSKGVTKTVRKPYSIDIWKALDDKTSNAIVNANYISKKKINENHNKFNCEPYTDIWELVDILLKP